MPFVVEKVLEPPRELRLGEVTGPLSWVLAQDCLTEFELRVLEEMRRLVRWDHRHVEAKVRCRDAQVGQSRMPNSRAHRDTTMDMSHPSRPERHLLYTTPPSTVFYAATEDGRVVEVTPPLQAIVSYGRYSTHRSPMILIPGPQLVIRVTETDVVSPRFDVKGR